MTLYFKTIFKPYFQRCKGLTKNESVLEVVRDFSQVYQPGLTTQLESIDKTMSVRYLDMLKMLVFCHRHHKNDAYLKNTPADFSVVREPMYKYSRAA
jgi:phage-related protein